MIKEMSKEIFLQYLDMTIDEIKQNEGVERINEDFKVVAIAEKGKLLKG